jgi:hypothetical protein
MSPKAVSAPVEHGGPDRRADRAGGRSKSGLTEPPVAGGGHAWSRSQAGQQSNM